MREHALRRPKLPLMGLRGAPRTRTRPAWGGCLVPPGPYGVSTPIGLAARRACRQPKPPETLLALSLPFRGVPPETRRVPPTRERQQTDPTSSPGLSSPYGTISGRWTRFGGCGSHRSRVPRPGFGYPHRGFHHRPYRRAKRRSAHGLHPSRRSPRRGRRPSRGPGPHGVVGTEPVPGGYEKATTDFRASISRRARSASDPEGSDRRCLHGILPFRAFSPSDRACALSRAADPLTLRRDDVPTRMSHRVLRRGRSGWSVSGLPALLGFSTFRLSRRSVRRSGGRAHGFASRGRPLARSPPL